MAYWTPGAFTAKRCALWRSLPPEKRVKLVDLVYREKERGKCYETELPVPEALE